MNRQNSYKAQRSRILNLINNDTLSVDDVVDIFCWTREVDSDYTEIANSLIEYSGRYLDSTYIYQFIRADITDDEAKKEIFRQKAFFQRGSILLPEMFSYLSLSESNIFGVIMLIDDMHHDFDSVKKAHRQDKEKRQILSGMRMTINRANDLIISIKDLFYLAQSDFENAYKATKISNSAKIISSFGIENLIEELELLCDSVEISLFKSKNDNNYLQSIANQAKIFVVENVYHLSCIANGPNLVTTPGSNFSTLCSIAYELISGIAEESLAGAISRFSRSSRKTKFDEDEAELETENQLGDNVDNFYAEKKKIDQASEKLRSLSRLLNSDDLSYRARVLLKKIVEYEEENIREADSHYGPNIVWAHQMPPSYYEKDDERIRKNSQKMKELEIELGRIRRALR